MKCSCQKMLGQIPNRLGKRLIPDNLLKYFIRNIQLEPRGMLQLILQQRISKNEKGRFIAVN